MIAGGITNDQIFSRRFDEAARTRNRGDVEIEYDPTDRLESSPVSREPRRTTTTTAAE